MFIHETVLLQETVDAVVTNKEGVYLDCTLGGGGHSALLLETLSPAGRVLGLDQDETALENARTRFEALGQFEAVRSNFRDLDSVLDERGIAKIDGVLYDLGVSSPQLDEGDRGFSYHQQAPLDMRMDRSAPLTAADVVNTYDKDELTRIILEYGEERWAQRIAQFIVEARAEKPLQTTGDLVTVIKQAIPSGVRREGGHPGRKTFQAIRIEVNDELGALQESLQKAVDRLTPGGRIAVITFHSLEDRIVKNFFQVEARGCDCPPGFPVCVCGKTPKLKILTRKPILADEPELNRNRRARSAKLRVAERIEK